MMQESQRRDMLESMGLKILQPRFQFAGAKPSVLLLQEKTSIVTSLEPVLPIISRVDAEVPLPVSVSGVRNISALFDSAAGDKKIDSVAGGKGVAATFKCRYRLVRVGELMMLLDQPSVEWHDLARCKAFFAEIHYALCDKKFEYWTDAQFDWNPNKNFLHANDKGIAREALQVFMREYAQQPPCKWILVWGGSVGNCLFDDAMGAGESAFIQDLPILMLDTCHEYWNTPQKKVLLWQHLQVVKKSMAANV